MSAVEVQTKDEHTGKTFYTSFYHSLLAPTLLSDVDGQFRGPDRQVHKADGYNYYTELSLWDMAALAPIVTEAGGRFTGLNGIDGVLQGNAAASNGLLHETLLGAVGF